MVALGLREHFDYLEDVAAPDVTTLKKYKRLRAVEVALCDPIHEMLTDAALNSAARSIGVRERGDYLIEHEDYGVILDLAAHHHRLRGKTVIERFLQKTRPAEGTDEHLALAAMMQSWFTLLRLGEVVRGVGVHAEDLLFGGHLFLADVALSKYKANDETVIVTRLLAFDNFVMTPCTSYLDFDPQLARMMAAGLRKESLVPIAERYASPRAKGELAADLTEMAICSIESVREALLDRFGEEPMLHEGRDE